MENDQGFVLQPNTYTQEEWYEMFIRVSSEYNRIINKVDCYEKEIDKWIQIMSELRKSKGEK